MAHRGALNGLAGHDLLQVSNGSTYARMAEWQTQGTLEMDKLVLYLYQNKKDNRYRIVYKDSSNKLHTQSYPRYLMEQKLGRPLSPNEDVHHIDGDVTNNDLSNLEIVPHGEHQKVHSQKYFDKYVFCDYCGKEFLWLATQQRNHYSNLSKKNCHYHGHIFCSKQCAGKFGRKEQLRRNTETECE